MSGQAFTPRILIVDDTAVNRVSLCEMLEAHGFTTSSAPDGTTARAVSRSLKPDLILLDVIMPDESGFETCALLKSDPETSDIPVIFLSSLDDSESRIRGLKTGGVDFVSKPVHGEELLARVRVHLRIRESNRAIARGYRARIEELRDAQRSILTRPESLPEASFAVYYEPLEEAGGDFYEVFAGDPSQFGYFVADVSGHGVSAAFLTAAIKAILHQHSGPLFSPEDTLRGIDAVMRQLLGAEQYLTACYANLSRRTGRLSVLSAGHPPLIIVESSGEAQTLEMDSDPLGVFSATVIQRRELRVSTGDRLFLYTDGLIESAPGASRREGIERLVEACRRHRTLVLPKAVPAIVRDVRDCHQTVQDDLLLLGIEVPE